MSFKPKYTLLVRALDCPVHGQVNEHQVEQFGGEPQWRGCSHCQFDALHSADPSLYKPAQQVHYARRLNEALLDSGIPRRFQRATLANYETQPGRALQASALKACTDYANDFVANWQAGRCLALLGTVGTGKTHLASGVIQSVIGLGATARYTSALGIIRDVKATFGASAASGEAAVYAALAEPNLLVVDEVGVQAGTEFERQVMFEVINARYEQKKPTVVISNLGVADLRKCLGDRAVDRLTDAQGVVVLFSWPSQRGAA